MQNQKITIFLSHSHKDIEKVRKIRDILETLDCEPLIFFLKCLDDRNEKLEEFIKEEIKARSIFVYCKSTNSENSVWVKKELDYINSFKNKRLYTIDIENDFSLGLINLLQQIAVILKRNRIFISYSHKDTETANAIKSCLESNGYNTSNDLSAIKNNSNWIYEIQKAIDTAIEEGIFIYIVSSNSLNSKFCLRELQYAISKNGYVLPIIIKENDEDNIIYQLPFELHNILALTIHKNPTKNDLDNLIKRLKDFN